MWTWRKFKCPGKSTASHGRPNALLESVGRDFCAASGAGNMVTGLAAHIVRDGQGSSNSRINSVERSFGVIASFGFALHGFHTNAVTGGGQAC